MRAARSYGLPFAGFGIPTGFLAGLAAGVWAGSVTTGLLVGLAGCALMGGFFALFIGTIDLVADRGSGPAGPRQDISVAVAAGRDLPDRIRSSLRQLDAEIRDEDIAGGHYVARTRWSWRSFGEDVAVTVTGDPSAPVARITSRPVVRTTLIDYGKGRGNVQRVADALRRQGG